MSYLRTIRPRLEELPPTPPKECYQPVVDLVKVLLRRFAFFEGNGHVTFDPDAVLVMPSVGVDDHDELLWLLPLAHHGQTISRTGEPDELLRQSVALVEALYTPVRGVLAGESVAAFTITISPPGIVTAEGLPLAEQHIPGVLSDLQEYDTKLTNQYR